jgi:pilus assembly protein Flp/PilA
MREFLTRLLKDNRGAAVVEYGLILALIFLAMIGAVQSFATHAITMWNTVDTTITTASG